MSTLSIQAHHALPAWLNIGLARIMSFVVIALEVFAEAQDQARAAHQRFPFAAW